MELEFIAAVVGGLVAINVTSRLRRRARVRARARTGPGKALIATLPKHFLRADRLTKRHGVGQPIKKFKDKIRIIGKPTHVFVGARTEGAETTAVYKGVDKKNWVRLFPNPGYRIHGRHWCLRTHRISIDWKEEA